MEPTWLEDVRKLDRESGSINVDRALDILFLAIDDLCWARRFEEIDRILGNLDPNEFSPVVLVGFLSCTNVVRSRLPSHAKFLLDVEKAFRKHGKSESEIRELVRGFS